MKPLHYLQLEFVLQIIADLQLTKPRNVEILHFLMTFMVEHK